MSAFTLHIGNKNYSSWSLRPYLVLAQTGEPFTEVVHPLYTPESKADLATFSPTGKVPVLCHGDVVIWDSLAIAEYLHELFPQAGLWPADRATRARARAISAEMHSGFSALRQNMTMDIRGRRPGVGHTAEALADAARVQQIWRECRARAEGGAFLFGGFTIADAMFAPVTTRFTTYGVPLDEVSAAYVAAVAAHPPMAAWIAAAAAEPWTITY
jgi:glutathione S-transferase